MASLTYSDLVGKFPELSGDADHQTRVGTFLELADLRVTADGVQPGALTLARLAYAAHLTALSNRTLKHGGGGVGQVTGRVQSGGASVSYSTVSAELSKQPITSTHYGLMYLDLTRGQGVLGAFVI